MSSSSYETLKPLFDPTSMAVIGASVGPIPVSLAFDYFGDVSTMLWVLAIYPLVVGIVAVFALATHPAVKGTEHLE